MGTVHHDTGIKRIVFLDFIHRLVSQEQTKLKIITDKRVYMCVRPGRLLCGL
jgi:hypothetical protein